MKPCLFSVRECESANERSIGSECCLPSDFPSFPPLPTLLFCSIENRQLALELVCGADFWCNRHCKTSPVDLEGFGGQVWPNIGRKPEKSEFRIANEPLRFSSLCQLCLRLSASRTDHVRLNTLFLTNLQASRFLRRLGRVKTYLMLLKL